MTKIEELEKQIDEMKATIEAMKAEEAKSNKFEFKYPEECYLLSMDYVDTSSGSYKDYLEYGRYRLTKEVAEQSLARNKRANRLEALAEYLEGLKEFKNDTTNYYIYYSINSNIWRTYVTYTIFSPEVIYMTEECATEICRLLNDGLFSLDG